MGTVNRVFVIGRLGRDPEMRYTPQGKAVCKFSVATDRHQGRNAEAGEASTDWHRVVAWERLAETCSQYLRKGRQVAVVGRIRYDAFTGKDGVKKWSTEIRASEVTFLGGRDDEPPASRGYGYGGAPAGPAQGPPGGMRPLVAVNPGNPTAPPAPGASDDLPF